MSKKIDKLRDDLRERVNVVEAKIQSLRANVEKAGQDAEAVISAKLDEAKQRVQESRRQAEAKRSEIETYIEEKKAETKETVEAWKAERDLKKIQRRADDAEAYAVFAVEIALSAVDEADVALLDAVLTRAVADAAEEAGTAVAG